MDIKNSQEIIRNILERYNFTAIYSDGCNKFGIETSKNYVDSGDALDFLYSSAILGSKALGIFTELPFYEIAKPLRAECIFITQTLPQHICTPTIIIKNVADISDRLTLALKISVEHKVPVTVVITHDALNNYTDFERANNDLGRISPYINVTTFKNSFSTEELRQTYHEINGVLMQSFPLKTEQVDCISLQHSQGYFPDFFIPRIMPEKIKKFNNKIRAYKNEKRLLEKFFFDNYNVEFNFQEIEDTAYPKTSNLLCPGCPFVNIFAKCVEKGTIVFTDITCQGVLQAFPEISRLTIDGYMGIISSDVRSSTLFIGKASSYKAHYNKFISKRGRVILLSDNGVTKIDGFSYIRHPKKLTNTKNILYPYCCNNIKKYSKVKAKLNKCSCIKSGQKCSAFEKTLCPAIYISSGGAKIDSTVCNGCLACKGLCSQGAIS